MGPGGGRGRRQYRGLGHGGLGRRRAARLGFIKEAAEVCVDLALKHGQRFICTSNFTHPHFKRLWADVAWHKAITTKS